MRSVALFVSALLVTLAAFVAGAPRARAAPAAAPAVVYVAEIDGTIDLGLVPYVDRTLREAAAAGAVAVIFEVNTFGGRVDAAVSIRDALLRSRTMTVAFVNKRAISAGALITLATETIAIAGGGTIGAAAPVRMGGPGERATPVEEKGVSYVRNEFRATADERKRPGLIAEAMVDADVEIPGLIEKGKLLTLTTAAALEHHVADFQADDLEQILARLGHPGAEIRRVGENWAEVVVRFLTEPMIASLLMSLGVMGLIVELRTPGFGIPGAVGFLALAGFFWGHFLVHLVGWEELALLLIGVVLVALEAFVIPGFGVAGILGVIALVAGLSTSLFGGGATVAVVVGAVARVAISCAAAALVALALFRFLPNLPGGRKLVLGAALKAGPGRDAGTTLAVGTAGTALTPLRPSGTASIEGRRLDVVSSGDFIAQGEEVEVVKNEGLTVVVKRRG